MSELAGADDTSEFPEAKPSAELVTAGDLLRRAREAAGLHIGALAVSLKVPVKKLEALEANQLDALPDAVFARALASSVCRTLKIDPQEILDRLPQNAAKRLKAVEEGINAPFRAKGDSGVSMSAGRYLSKPVVVFVGLLLLGALALLVVPSKPQDVIPVVSTQMTDVPPVQPMVLEAPTIPVTSDVSQSGSSAVATVAVPVVIAMSTPPVIAVPPIPSAVASIAVVTPSVTPVVVKPAPVASASAVGAATVVAEGVLVLKAKAPVWVQVTDAKGVVQLSKTLAAGESAAVSGALPLATIVGRVDAMEVQVRGKAFDLLPVSKDNVARFEVK